MHVSQVLLLSFAAARPAEAFVLWLSRGCLAEGWVLRASVSSTGLTVISHSCLVWLLLDLCRFI